MTDPYQRLTELAEQEWSAVAGQVWEELPVIAAERSALVAALPAVPPRTAERDLRRLSELQALVSAALTAARGLGGAELTRLTQRRDALRGYAVAGR